MPSPRLKTWSRRLLLTVSIIPVLLGVAIFNLIEDTGYTALPDGSRIKLLAVTSGTDHQVRWKRFSAANTLRRYSREFGPYVTPENTEIVTTTSVDCTVFWTRRVFGDAFARPLSAVVEDEQGNRDRVAQPPNAFSVLRDRFASTTDGAVQGWPVARTALLGTKLKLHLFERQDTSTGTVTELVQFDALNPYASAAPPHEPPPAPQKLNHYELQLTNFTSGVSYPPPPGFFEFFFRPPGPTREFLGTSITLQLAGARADQHSVFARRIRGKSTGGLEFSTFNLRQTTAPGLLEIAFLPSCSNDYWDFDVELGDQAPAAAENRTTITLATADAESLALDADPDDMNNSGRWYSATHIVPQRDNQPLQLQVRCGPFAESKFMCLLFSSGEQRQPLQITGLVDDTDTAIPYERDDLFSVRAVLEKRTTLQLEVTDWPTTAIRFRARPTVLMPELLPAASVQTSRTNTSL